MGLHRLDSLDDNRKSFKYGQSSDRKKDPQEDFYV
jgi:hypothetical protein